LRIFITGVNGYLGSGLARYWLTAGHAVCGSVRDVLKAPPGLARVEVIPLGGAISESALCDCQTVIHCAHDFSAGAADTNLDGTQMLFRAARNAGVSRQIFLSSYSARPDAATSYGRIKYNLECFFLECGATVIRPGVVLGDGGLFGKSLRRLLKTRIVPLVDGGRDLLPVIGIRDFLAAMTIIAESSAARAYNLFYAELVPLLTLAKSIHRLAGRRGIYVDIPLAWAHAALRLASALKVRFPVGEANLRALEANRVAIHQSSLPELTGPWMSFNEALAEAVAAASAHRDRP
jgi:NADH dehydrogenase